MFFASGSKNQGIYNVFVPVPSKNTGIYEKEKNTVFYDVFASRAQQNIVQTLLKNGPKPTSKSIFYFLYNFSIFLLAGGYTTHGEVSPDFLRVGQRPYYRLPEKTCVGKGNPI